MHASTSPLRKRIAIAAAALSLIVAGCGGGDGGTSSTTLAVAGASNVVAIRIDGGPDGNALNAPYVSVTVCEPGTTNCQTVDHVVVDTGSFGLRLVKPGVLNDGLGLPAVTTAGGNELGECAQFADGFAWGAVRRADVKLAGAVAAAIPIHAIGDKPGGAAAVPRDCSNTGADIGSVARLGANGILGVGMFDRDCDVCTISVIPATYYACTTSGCVGTRITAAQAVSNPVAHFPQDNNGVLLDLPAVALSGATNPTGSLIFGIGTQANNALGSATKYPVDNVGNFITTYNGKTITHSFADSGSNAIFFNDAAIAQCSNSVGFYCPAAPLSLSANIRAASGNANATVSFGIVNVDSLSQSVTAANAGGTAGSGFGGATFDWGLPFFFDRRVFTAIQGAATPVGTGPFLAF